MEATRRTMVGVLIGATASGALTESLAASAPAMAEHPMVARIWHGRTPADKADEYRQYLFDVGIKKIATLPTPGSGATTRCGPAWSWPTDR